MRSDARDATAESIEVGVRGSSPLAAAAGLLASLALLLAILAPAASAAPVATTAFAYQSSFGAGEFTGSISYHVSGLAVDPESGNILAPDEFLPGVRVFAPDPVLGGTPLTQFSTGSNPVNIAIDQETGATFTTDDFFGTTFRRLTSDGAAVPSYTVDPGFAPTVSAAGALAVDPTSHDVLGLAGQVKRFDPDTGEMTKSFQIGGGAKFFLAVGLDGSIYVAGNGPGLRYSSSGSFISEFAGPATSLNDGGLTTDPVSGNILVAGEGRLLALTPTGQKAYEVALQPGGVNGLAIDPVRERLYVRNPSTGGIDAYVPAPYAGIEAPTVSALTPTGFHLSTEVDPGEKEGGGLPDGSSMHFEYRLSGEPDWTSTPDQAVGAPGQFGADVTGLEPNLVYEVRAVASNSLTTNVTDTVKVTTVAVPPITVTGAATDVSETRAVLNGTINPVGLQTTYHFEYGTTTAYGSRIPVGIDAIAGGGRVVQAFNRTITGLSPGTTYHFRLVATNAAGTTEGPDRTFMTVAAGGIPVRAYEQVTPADKHGAAVIPRLGMQAAADGNGLAFVKKAGSKATPIVVRGIAVRGAGDWKGDIDGDPPINQGTGGFLVHAGLAVSDDFTHALGASNRALAPGGIEEGGNLYRIDLSDGSYEFIGGSSAPGTFDSFAYSVTTGTFLAGAPDFSWVVFVSPNPLIPGAPKAAVYRWSVDEGLEVVSVLPNGDLTGSLRADVSPVYKTVSADGSKIYFTGVGGSEEGVFLHEGDGPATPVSVSHVPGDPATPQPAVLLGTNKDGRYAFFICGAKLTEDAGGEQGDLYRWDSSDGSLEYLGAKAFVAQSGAERLSVGSMGISDDGGTIYFNAFVAGQGPLTVWREGIINTVFPKPIPGGSERPSPNGRYYVFYDTVDGVENVIQRYDAAADEIICISCLPDGTPVPALLPDATVGDTLYSNRAPRSVDNEGTVYFDTTARLVAADVNGTRDVYVHADGTNSLISPGNRSFDAIVADVSADGSDVFFTTAQKLVGRDNDEEIDIYDARVDGGLAAQSPPPPQQCLRDDCKATPSAGPELPFGGSEALSGPENLKPRKQAACGENKRKVKVNGRARCVKKKPGKHKKKAGKKRASKSNKGGNR